MKKITLFLVVALIISMITGCGSKGDVYTGTSLGYGGEMTVEVTIVDEKISKVEIASHGETPGIGSNAIDVLPSAIVETNSIMVDTVSGATVTSLAIQEAVKNALVSGGFDVTKYEVAASISMAALEDNTYDVVVIGAGGAGLSAAIEAKHNGAENVIVVEKMSFAGGNTLLSYAELAAPGNWVQLEKGIEDSVELFANEMWEGGGKIAKKEMVDIVAEGALDAALWMRDYIGVEYQDYLVHEGGHSVARAVEPITLGPGMITPMVKKAEEMGVELVYNTKASELVVDTNGRVTGVVVERDGTEAVFSATMGVILATGGFGANIEMREAYNKTWETLDETIPTTNSPSIQGDGIVMAEEIGAQLEGMEYIQLYPFNNPITGTFYSIEAPSWSGEGLVYVNQEGKRFVNELGMRNERSSGILAQDGNVFAVYNQEVADRMNLEEKYAKEYATTLEQGLFYKADTLEELAEYFDIDSDNLVETMANYNSYMDAGLDPEFGRTTSMVTMKEGPWFAMIGVPSVHHTMGGVMIDELARVIGEDNQPIKGLYAAGEVTGSIHGNNRVGTCAITEIVVFGRIAGVSAVQGL